MSPLTGLELARGKPLKQLNVNGGRVDGVTAKGNGGQRIYLWPGQNMVVVITAGSYNEPSAADELQIKYILPAVGK